MTHPDTHPGSRPEDRFDAWLDGLVAGTPADAASFNGTDGSLARAISGARQLHGLATREAPVSAAQRRIEEDLMRSGTLAAPRGTTWTPIEKETRRGPWWSPTSPVIAAALVVAMIVALGASFIATQRPADAPTPAPGFAMASPGATEPTPVGSLPIIKGDPGEELRSHFGSFGVIDDDGLTITRPGEDDLIFPGVTAAMPNGVPGEAVLTRDDGTRSVADLTTGETRFDLPETSGSESQAGAYLFVTESGENADWTAWDLRTGDSRPLSEIVDLPADQPVIPTLFGRVDTESTTVYMQFLMPEFETAAASDIPSFVIAGSLDRATTLDGYPPASQARESLPVVSRDGATVAWAATEPENAIVVADTATGEELARFDLGTVSPYAVPAGFTADGERLVVLTSDRVLMLGWTEDEAEQTAVAEGMTGALYPVFYAPAGALYYYEGDALQRMTIPDADVTTILDGFVSSSLPMYAAPGSPWIFASLGTEIALIDARTGEVVSNLRDMPTNEAEFGALSLSTSRDGATVIQMIGGSESGYLVSTAYPDGLVLTAPVGPEIIAASESPDGIPVHYTLSPDGSSVAASTFDGVATPRFVARVGPDPEWVPIDDIDALYWLPMPASDADADAVTLPAQDFATPMASPAASGLSCASPGYLPVVSGEAEAADLATIGAPGSAIRVTDDGVTVPLPDGGETTLPAGSMPVTSVPGTYVTVKDDGSRTVTSTALGETWEFPALDFSDTGSDAVPAAFSFVAAGPYVAGPVDATGLDWRIVDVRTGEEVTTSELLDGLFPWMVVPQSAAPRSDADLQSITFVRATQGMPEITSEIVAPDEEATNRALNGTVAAILPGSVESAEIVDLGGLTDGVGSLTMSPIAFSQDGAQVAWRGWTDIDGEGSFAFLAADRDDIANPRVLMRISAPLGYAPLLFSKDGTTLYVVTSNAIQAIPLAPTPKGVEQVRVIGQDQLGILSVNRDAGTAIFAGQGGFGPETWILDTGTGEAHRLPKLDGFTEFMPFDGAGLLGLHHYALGELGSGDGSTHDVIVVNTATGSIVAETSSPTSPAGRSRVSASIVTGLGHVVTFGDNGALHVVATESAGAWPVPLPDIEFEITDPAIYPSVRISPDGGCLLLAVFRDVDHEEDLTRGPITPEPVGSWLAPLTPGAEWTKLPFALVDWWPVPIDEAEPRTLPAQDFPTPAASPAAGASCEVTRPNGDVPPGENANLDWIGSGAGHPSLWLMLTWDDGIVTTNQVDGGYPVKLTFWRGEGSGDVTVTATGPDGETLPADTFAPFKGDPIPGLHPFGGILPEPGCWTFTASDGNDTLTWAVDVHATPATPVAASAPGAVMVIEGTAAEARVEHGVRIATLGNDGLTLPVASGTVRIPDAVRIETIGSDIRDRALVTRSDGTGGVIDLASGAVLHDVPAWHMWSHDYGAWRFIPANQELTDWTVVDLTTGETRLLSQIVALPGDTAVMPDGLPTYTVDATPVIAVVPGSAESGRWTPSGPAVATFVIAGSLDRVVALPDYPTALDNVGRPALVASADGGMVAYEVRNSDCLTDQVTRIVILDVATGNVLACASSAEVSENPMLAGFTTDGQRVALATSNGKVMMVNARGGGTLLVRDGLGRLDNPLFHAPTSTFYVREGDRLLRIPVVPGRETTEVATGLTPAPFGFTTPGGNWIVAQTRDGHIMVDARTGEVVSRLKAPANRSWLPDDQLGPQWFAVDDDGDTIIFAIATTLISLSPNDVSPAAWLLSPAYPDGRAVPAPENAGGYWLSPDGSTLYAYTGEQLSGSRTIWSTALGEEPHWQPVVADVTPLPGPVMFFPKE